MDVIGNELIPEKSLSGILGETYRRYRSMLDRYHCLTFSLIIQSAVEALGNPAIFQRVNGPLRHLVVDEYQDINPAQEQLIERLSSPPVELCVVGDDDQCIYQWRGSDVTAIQALKTERRKVHDEKLEANRRAGRRLFRRRTPLLGHPRPTGKGNEACAPGWFHGNRVLGGWDS